MPKWSKDAKEFEVVIDYDEEKGSRVRVPKPLLGKLGNPRKLKFLVKDDKIEVKGSKD